MFKFLRGHGSAAAYAFWCGYCVSSAVKSLLAGQRLAPWYYATLILVYWFWFNRRKLAGE